MTGGRVEVLTATVYKGGGRRWFSLKAAENAEARKIIRRRCECVADDHYHGPGETCWLHAMPPARMDRLKHLLIVMFVRRTSPPPQAPIQDQGQDRSSDRRGGA